MIARLPLPLLPLIKLWWKFCTYLKRTTRTYEKAMGAQRTGIFALVSFGLVCVEAGDLYSQKGAYLLYQLNIRMDVPGWLSLNNNFGVMYRSWDTPNWSWFLPSFFEITGWIISWLFRLLAPFFPVDLRRAASELFRQIARFMSGALFGIRQGVSNCCNFLP